jgi:hypothetical protein
VVIRNKFVTGRLQSLCATLPQQPQAPGLRVRGYFPDVGADGWPTDPTTGQPQETGQRSRSQIAVR